MSVPPPDRSEFTVGDLLRTLYRHRGIACSVFLAVMVMVTVVMWLTPRIYCSHGELLIRVKSEQRQSGPEESLQRSASVADPQLCDERIDSTVKILKSRALIEQVVDTVGANAILGRVCASSPADAALSGRRLLAIERPPAPSVSGGDEVASWRQDIEPDPPEQADVRTQAIQRAAERLSVKVLRRCGLITISFRAHSPEVAQAVVSSLMTSCLDRCRLSRDSAEAALLAGRRVEMLEQLARKQAQLGALRQELGPVSIAGQRTVLVRRMARLEQHVRTVDDACTEAMVNLQQLRERLAPVGPVVSVQLVAEEQMPEHGQAADEPGARHEELQLALAQETTRLEALKVQAEQLRSQLAAAGQELHMLDGNAQRFGELKHQIALLESDYRECTIALEQARIDRVLEDRGTLGVSIARPATLETTPIHPKWALNLVLGLLCGALGGVGVALMADLRQPSLRTPEQLEKHLDLSLLASIPMLGPGEVDGMDAPIGNLLWQLDPSSGGWPRNLQTVGVTSCRRGEGVSSVAARLAATAASGGERRVLLVEFNFSHPVVHHLTGTDPAPGLGDLHLLDDDRFATAFRSSRVAGLMGLSQEQLEEVIQPTGLAGLSVLTVGRSAEDAARLHHSADLEALVEIAGEHFDTVVFDLPPAGLSGPALRLASLLDGVVLVVEAEHLYRKLAQQTLALLSLANVRILGAVLNKYPK